MGPTGQLTPESNSAARGRYRRVVAALPLVGLPGGGALLSRLFRHQPTETSGKLLERF